MTHYLAGMATLSGIPPASVPECMQNHDAPRVTDDAGALGTWHPVARRASMHGRTGESHHRNYTCGSVHSLPVLTGVAPQHDANHGSAFSAVRVWDAPAATAA